MKKKKSVRSNKKKAVKKKTAKKPAKKKAAKKAAKKSVKRAAPKAPKMPKPIGKVTHYYTHIKVALVKFTVKTKAGTTLWFKGATTDFKDAPKSLQYDHKPIAVAPVKKLIGVKVPKRVREGDLVYKA